MSNRRIGIVHPYWSFWESAVDIDFAEDRKKLGELGASTIATGSALAWSVTVGSDDDIPTLIANLDRDIDAIVIISTMAASPGAVLRFLAAFPSVPVVIWAAHLGRAADQSLSHTGITLRGGTVGSPMIGAALSREGRPFDIFAGEITEREAISDAVRRAAAAGAVRRSRLGIVGTVLPGYEWARVSNERLKAMGIEVVASTADQLAARVHAVSPDEIAEARTTLDGFDVDADVSAGALDTALRYSVALQSLVDDERLTAGTLNCHVAQLRLDPSLGSAPCMALGRSTTKGVPWTCTGDVATSLAMLLVSSLGDPTLYHEIEVLDERTDEAIIANSGEHDGRFNESIDRRIINNPWFSQEKATASALFSIAPGPASLVGVASGVDGALTIVVAEGHFTERTAPDSGTVNVAFQFLHSPVTEAWQRWASTGVGHHSCATDRHVARDMEKIAHHLGIEFFEV
jgi:L-fucose isomerase-like protein